jgi:diguanylate cyclase
MDTTTYIEETAAPERTPLPDGGAAASNAQGARIAVLLDSAASAQILVQGLAGMGYGNAFAVDAGGGMHQALLNQRPDLVLMDTALDGQHGVDMLMWMRAEKSLSETPVILLSEAAAGAERLRALELRVNDYLVKPVDLRELSLRMRNLLALTARRPGADDEDRLTGLGNRQRFNALLEWALTYSRRTQSVGAVLQIGIDRFAAVNEALGHAVGDQLLREVAGRLARSVRDTDLVAGTDQAYGSGEFGVAVSRVGGDEFSVLLPVIQRAEQAATVATRIRAAMAAPCRIGGHELIATCCIGIAVFPADGTVRDVVLGNATTAMAHAKQRGRDRHEYYGKEMNSRSLERLALERDLRVALANNAFTLAYQPKVNVQSGMLCGAEALLRWDHPERGMISPAEFIPVAEDIDMIGALGDWVLREACRQIGAWQSLGMAAPCISVNISARQMQDEQFEANVMRVLDETRIGGGGIMLEITESALMKDPPRAAAAMGSLRERGVGISIDDFGTGYSSLAYLRRFPLDELKIDKSFLTELTADGKAIVSAIITLGHSLRLKVVAEGVEHQRELDFLRTHGCDEYQGYLFRKPLAPDEFESLMALRTPISTR